ncbi:uncharacterized protein LOC117173596 [Belonocnema kinseyi]|uniref:uncharacterized protein LOC117173596 n=1 Tax=Belonocnema kinseyi TaxID=2817044 RepID=UPI00143CD176|nr:uncharacterized protein LOC117173596 [Belonocnema kinseyi]
MGDPVDVVKIEDILSKTEHHDSLASCGTVSDTLIIPEMVDNVEVNKDGYFTHNGHVLEIMMDYECVTCHRVFQTKDMLTEHLEVCREEDDSTHLLDLGNLDGYYDSDEEDADNPKYRLSDDRSSDSEGKNNNVKPSIKPVSESQCHCCAEDLKTAHSGGPYKCDDCDLSFKKSSSLQRHSIIVHWERENVSCSECNATFRDKKALDKHRYTTHSTTKVYKCERCDKYFSRSYHLNRHKLQSGCHGKIQNTFSCQVCKKVFTRKDNLREHVRSHMGKPQRQKKRCSHCPKEFYTAQQLVVHERMHTGEKPIQCDLCTKTFNSTLAMKKHRRVHTGEKPYECKFRVPSVVPLQKSSVGIGSMLRQRRLETKWGEGLVKGVAPQGCPQGGVLSPLLWCIIVDGLLRRLNEEGYYSQGYADDFVILVRGAHLETLMGLTRSALRIVELWCDSLGLLVNLEKTKMVIFTKNYKMPKVVAPVFCGGRLTFSDSVKYLGVILDSRLSWAKHLETQCRNFVMTLWMCRRAFGLTWGIGPKMLAWLCSAVLKPRFLHAVVDCWPRAKLKTMHTRWAAWAFRVYSPSRDAWKENGNPLLQGEIWYTDGLGGGAVAGIHDRARRREVVVPLGRHATVFQAEVLAVLRSAEILLEENAAGRQITICSDSQTTLTAVGKPDIISELVWECKKALNRLTEKIKVALIRVHGHTGIKSNQKADQLARSGAAGEYIGLEPVLGLASCCIGLAIKSWIRTKHREYWEQVRGCRQTNSILGYTCRMDRAREILGLPKKDIFGWPTEPVQDILEAVIRRCGHQPLTGDSDLPFAERLRENVKLLFTVVIDDANVKSLLTTQTVDEVILHVLKLSKEYDQQKQE